MSASRSCSSVFRGIAACLLSTLLLLTLAACSLGDEEDPTTTTQPPPQSQPAEQADQGEGSFIVIDSGVRYSVTEGSQVVQIPVSISRSGGHSRQINLSLDAADTISGKNLAYSLQDNSLGSNESSTVINVKLDIAVAPLLPHQRNLVLTAEDGSTTSIVSVQLDIVPIQAPDVYLLAGQSNMEGYSELDAKDDGPGGLDEPDPRILQLNVTANDSNNFDAASDFTSDEKNIAFPRYVVAEDPLHQSFNPSTNGKTGRRIGLGMSFAKAALANTTQEIMLVPAAWAGTGFCDNNLGELAWNPAPVPGDTNLAGTGLYDRAIARVNVALKESGGILRGILWHQGEADATSTQCSSVYAGNLTTLIDSMRTDIRMDARGPTARGSQSSVPFVLGTMSRGDDSRGEFSIYDLPKSEVDLVHRSIETESRFIALSNHDDLIPPAYECGEGFCIHFGAEAYREMGRRYYQRLQALVQDE